MSDLITELSDQIDSVIDGYYAGATPEIVAPVKAEIERLEAALRRSCQCGDGMYAITGEQCLACAALKEDSDV